MMRMKEKLCVLCYLTIRDNNFEIIEDVTKDILNIVLLKLDFKENNGVICNMCSIKLLQAFDFKSKCLSTDDKLIPHINYERTEAMDLLEIYLKENENKDIIFISNDDKICRLCMEIITGEFTSFSEIEADIIQKYIPEVDFGATTDPVICELCNNSLSLHGNFIKKCLTIQKTKYCGRNKNANSSHVLSLTKQTEKNAIDCELYDQENSVLLTSEENKNPRELYIKLDISSTMMKKHKDESIQPKESIKKNEAHVPKSGESCNRISSQGKIQKLRNLFECRLCSFKTTDKSSKKSHKSSHMDSSGMYKCSSCDYSSKHLSHYCTHLLKHDKPSNVQLYECYTCEFKSKYKKGLKRHTLIHLDFKAVDTVKCDICGYETMYKQCLLRHLATHKKSETGQLYECDICGYETMYKHSLLRHLATHKKSETGQLYECDQCDFKVRHKGHLTKHMISHMDPSEIVTYQCKKCTYTSVTKKALRTHTMRRHSKPAGTQPFKCHSCDYESDRKYSLTRHMATHKKNKK